ATFRGVSADSVQTVQMQGVFGVAATAILPATSAHYLMAHSSQTFLVNDRGALIVMFAFASGWDVIAADVKQLLD
ncbi:MAG: SCO family protein, partial [Gemmatimonadota bacterium]|nr:SCO family protein [Gemmatimonadota bacterium]